MRRGYQVLAVVGPYVVRVGYFVDDVQAARKAVLRFQSRWDLPVTVERVVKR